MPLYSLCDPTGAEQDVTYHGIPTTWREVDFINSQGAHTGWVYGALLEEYDPEDFPPVVSIPFPTPNPNDAAQYMIWKGQVQYNLCGELCAAYLAGVSLATLLDVWEAKAITFFQRVFGSGGRARGTDLGELDSMLSLFGFSTPSLRLDAGLRDPILNRALVTPARMERMLQTHRAIVGVKIGGVTGYLRGGGIAHWVVVEQVYPNDVNRGHVEIYNPFSNTMQGYSWSEFVNSMGSPYGIWVARR
jgi:hypothetical protein